MYHKLLLRIAPAFLGSINNKIPALSWQSFFGFGQSAEVEIELANSANRKQVDVKNEDGKKEKLFLYYDGETVSGKVQALTDLYLTYFANTYVVLNCLLEINVHLALASLFTTLKISAWSVDLKSQVFSKSLLNSLTTSFIVTVALRSHFLNKSSVQ